MKRLRTVLILSCALLTLAGVGATAAHQHHGDAGKQCRVCDHVRTPGEPEPSAAIVAPVVLEAPVQAAPRPLPGRVAIASQHRLRAPPLASA